VIRASVSNKKTQLKLFKFKGLGKISLPAFHVSFIPPKNPILPLLKNLVRRNRNFSNEKFWFFETKVEGKTKNSGVKKNRAGLEEKSSYFSRDMSPMFPIERTS
jgi:hypothetical protein